MTILLQQVRMFLQQHAICDGPLVVAVSGGPDSVGLLRALVVMQKEFAIEPLVVAHLNHRLRGQESDDDQAFVQSTCEQLGASAALVFRTHVVDVLAQKPPGDSVESAARAARYDWLAAVALQAGARWVATGHTADDQAETVLHRLVRGTGVAGLAAIPACRPLVPGVDLIRPMLSIRRHEVLAYLDQFRQSFRRDSSNDDPGFLRNRIRLELLPLLEQKFNPAIVEVLCRLSTQARALRQEVEANADQLLQRAELPRAGTMVVIDSTQFGDASDHDLGEMFRLVWRREKWPQQHMGFQEWQRLASIARGDSVAADLPGHVRARRRDRILQLEMMRPPQLG